MKLRSYPRALRAGLLTIASGATAYQLSGCDPAVRDSVFSGLQSATVGLVTTFVNAGPLPSSELTAVSAPVGGKLKFTFTKGTFV